MPNISLILQKKGIRISLAIHRRDNKANILKKGINAGSNIKCY